MSKSKEPAGTEAEMMESTEGGEGRRASSWQGSLKQRISTAFKTGFRTDIILSLGEEGSEVHSHKFLLQISSPLLDRMIDNLGSGGFVCGSSGLPILRIPDVDPKIFKLMLEYFYTEGVTCLEPKKEDEGSRPCLKAMTDLLGLATKYEVGTLANCCVNILKAHIGLDTALELFQGRMEYGHKGLIGLTLIFINKHASEILKDKDFVQLTLDCLIEIIKQDDLAVYNEMEVFDAVYRWGEEQIKNSKSNGEKENTSTSMRSILKKPLAYIRFPLMNKRQFAREVATRNLLTADETISLLISFLLPVAERSALPEGRFISTRRKHMGISKEEALEKTMTAQSGFVLGLQNRIQALEEVGRKKEKQVIKLENKIHALEQGGRKKGVLRKQQVFHGHVGYHGQGTYMKLMKIS